MSALILALIPFLFLSQEESLTHKSYDGFPIEAKWSLPEGKVDRVIVLLGGSGAYDMDLDLTAASKGGKTKILWLKDVSDALVSKGFATLRYNKRNYQLQKAIEKRRKAGKNLSSSLREHLEAFKKNPLKSFVEDAKSFASFAREQYPNAKILFLGASEGTHVALFASHELGWISGVGLIGFYTQTLDIMTFEQTIYRDESYFYNMDKDNDGALSKEELGKGGAVGFALLVRIKGFDINRDDRIRLSEYRAFRLWGKSTLGDLSDYVRQELSYPSMKSILLKAEYPVAFFQGMWDNQTPAYNTMEIDAINRLKWKKSTLKFRYFEKRGHILDPRKSYYDLTYSPIAPDSLEAVATDMTQWMK